MDVTAYVWIGWIVLILVFVTVEMLTLTFVFAMLALGSLGGLVAELLGADWWLQILIAAVVSVLLLFALRPPLLHRLRRGGDPTRSNVEALIGISAAVVYSVTAEGGQVKLANGETWTARLSPESQATRLEPGDRAAVVAIDGATAVVTSSEGSPQ